MTDSVLFNAPSPGPGDYHAHIFPAKTSALAKPRYVPDYSAPLSNYLKKLDENKLIWGTLVQPSFLGTDNSHLLKALEQCPERLRAVVVLDELNPALTCAEPEKWDQLGVRGVRLNLIGREAPQLRGREWSVFLDVMCELGWHLEIQAKPGQLIELEPVIGSLPCRVVIDHMGLPDSAKFNDHPLSRLSELDNLWVKASGAYRSPAGLAEMVLESLIDRGYERLVFGSDWPHTRYETVAGEPWAWAHRPELQPTA